ncbi:hypothetical protein CAL7716_057320 [Calothrix sp. PCC 7716]|nr:hypothetical protein CAL7716_057320 [Calothrix sp. PCC 7716]
MALFLFKKTHKNYNYSRNKWLRVCSVQYRLVVNRYCMEPLTASVVVTFAFTKIFEKIQEKFAKAVFHDERAT